MPETLPIPQLGRFIGKMVMYDVRALDGWKLEMGELRLSMLMAPMMYRNFRPVLRELSSLSAEEVKTLVRVSFGWEWGQPIRNLTYSVLDGVLSVHVCGPTGSRFYFQLSSTGCIEVMLQDKGNDDEEVDLAHFTNAANLFGYLDSISIDYKGLIKAGLAVKQE